KLRGVLDRYRVPHDGASGGWLAGDDVRRLTEAERARLQADVGETFYLMAQVAHLQATGAENPSERAAHLQLASRWNAVAERHAGDRLPHSLREQRAAVAELRGEPEAARQLRE